MSTIQKQSSLILSLAPWEKLNDIINNESYSSINIILDENTETHCLPYFLEKSKILVYSKFTIQSGEKNKTLATCEALWNHWLSQQIDRKALIICLGGGIICDVGGFAASVILRGVDCVYVPTSLMAMADAAIGGKTAINLNHFKNQIGSFIPPKAVVIDQIFLKTLPERHLRNGFVEIIKHSLIQSPPYWQDIKELGWPLDVSNLQDYLKKSIRTKTHIVEQDFYEHGIRKSLNFGHTIGHAIESYYLSIEHDILHGEAIAIGIICESYISAAMFNWKPYILEQLKTFLLPFTGSIKISESWYPEIFKNLQADKKKLNQITRFSLLEAPGLVKLDQLVPETLVLKSLDYYNLN
ncbi:MAG: 3-dehydroquinate synthase family protein [Saprospiraceae bacterium]